MLSVICFYNELILDYLLMSLIPEMVLCRVKTDAILNCCCYCLLDRATDRLFAKSLLHAEGHSNIVCYIILYIKLEVIECFVAPSTLSKQLVLKY